MTIIIPGHPKGKARPRVTRNGTYTPESTKSYEDYVRWMYRSQCDNEHYGKGVPLTIIITAFFPIPKSATKQQRADMLLGKVLPTKKPDIDNICKIITDALNGYAYHDDAQIVTAHIDKRYADKPRVTVMIRRYE